MADAESVASPSTAPGAGATRPPVAVDGAIAEQLTRIERVIWTTPVAAAVEPWVTPRWVQVERNRTTGATDSE